MGLVLLGGACSGSSDGRAAPTTAVPGVTTTLRYRGDADSRFCRAVRAGIPAVARAGQGRPDPDAAWAQARAVHRLLRPVVGRAPEAIRTDVAELVTGLERVLEILDRAGGDPERVPADQQQTLAQSAPTAAAGRVQVYLRQVCGRPLPFLPG